MSQQTRLVRLERQIDVDKAETTIIRVTCCKNGPDGPQKVPIAGWRFGRQAVVTRRRDETDEELAERALTAAKATGGGPFLMTQIVP